MRTLKLHFPDNALPTLDTFIKQTKEARVFRRAQAVRHVVQGQRLQTVSDALSFTYSALRKWVYRFANQGVQGLGDRPRSGIHIKLRLSSRSGRIEQQLIGVWVFFAPIHPAPRREAALDRCDGQPQTLEAAKTARQGQGVFLDRVRASRPAAV